MREILFRGKRTDNGKWVQGDLLHTMQGVLIADRISDNGLRVDILNAYDVVPETVGQYTGLTDNNGTKIFEGDVISLHTLYNNEITVEVVHFSNGGFFAGTYPIYNVGAPCNQNNIVILGNIHDNPELMEV